MADMANASDFILSVKVITQLDNQDEPCPYCQLEDQVIQAQAYATTVSGHRRIVECCLSCLIPQIDGTPYLDAAVAIVVEVARTATLRPF